MYGNFPVDGPYYVWIPNRDGNMGHGNMDYGNMRYGNMNNGYNYGYSGMNNNNMNYENRPSGYSGRGNRYAGLRRDCADDDPEWDYDDWRGSLTGSSMDGPRNGRLRSMMDRGMWLEDREEWRDEHDEDWLVRSQRSSQRRRGY